MLKPPINYTFYTEFQNILMRLEKIIMQVVSLSDSTCNITECVNKLWNVENTKNIYIIFNRYSTKNLYLLFYALNFVKISLCRCILISVRGLKSV